MLDSMSLCVLLLSMIFGAVSPSAIVSKDKDHLYTFAVGYDEDAMLYLNEEGFTQGFHKDLMEEVCAAAGIRCATMYDSYAGCSTADANGNFLPGRGLLDRYYDTCYAWKPFPLRMETFDFSLPFYKSATSHFYVLVNSDKEFDVNNPTAYNIGVMKGWLSSRPCMLKNGINIPVEQTFMYETREEAMQGLKDDQVRALFGATDYYLTYVAEGTVEALPSPSIVCEIGGYSLMTRKDNDLIPKWNEGFMKLKESGRFAELCEEAQVKHVTPTRPLPPCAIE